MKYIIELALKSIRYRKATLLLSIVSISMSVVLLLGVERLRSKVEESFTSTISGTDLIVGARSGNIPILLSTVFHIGYPNQNVSWLTFEEISSIPQVDWSIPLSIGDSHKGFSVVATTDDFFAHFEYGNHQQLKSKNGEACVHGKQGVLGARAAKELGYKIGDELVVTHGMGQEEFIKHEDEPFIIAGILEATGTPVDQSIFVSVYAMDAIHSHFYGEDVHSHDVFAELLDSQEHLHEDEEEIQTDHDHSEHELEHAETQDHSAEEHENLAEQNHSEDEHGHNHSDVIEMEPKSVSGFLLGLKNPTDILSVQRMLNEYKDEPLTAIMPVVTLLELWSIVRPIEKTLLVISILVLIVALGGILTTIITSLNDRRREMAILRSVGAKPKHIFGLIVLETAGVVLSGIITGAIVLQVVLKLLKPVITEKLGLVIKLGWFSVYDGIALLIIFICGCLIGLIPAWYTYRNALSDGLMINK